jgi:hypothetical protein
MHSVGREGFEPSKLSQQIYSLPPLAAWVPTRVFAICLFVCSIYRFNPARHVSLTTCQALTLFPKLISKK